MGHHRHDRLLSHDGGAGQTAGHDLGERRHVGRHAEVRLSAAGRNLGGGSLDIMARSFQGSRASLGPIARLLGETDVGSLTRAVLGAYEGLLFGIGTILGLTRRPRLPDGGPG